MTFAGGRAAAGIAAALLGTFTAACSTADRPVVDIGGVQVSPPECPGDEAWSAVEGAAPTALEGLVDEVPDGFDGFPAGSGVTRVTTDGNMAYLELLDDDGDPVAGLEGTRSGDAWVLTFAQYCVS